MLWLPIMGPVMRLESKRKKQVDFYRKLDMCVPYVLQPRAGSMNPDAIKSLKNNKQKQKRLVSSRSNRESE